MDRLIRYWNNLSIRTTLVLYTIFFLLLATALSTVTLALLESWNRNKTMQYYQFEESVFTNAKGQEINASIAVNADSIIIPERDQTLMHASEVLQMLVIPFMFGACIIGAAFLFYRYKLRQPIQLIIESASKIANNDLDFSLHYDRKDEMGQLCDSLEVMRSSLETNNRSLWRMVEERRRLNAAFSHDLRTPLTVLRGYSDFLGKFRPQGKINEEKLLSTLKALSKHTARLQSYVETMNDIQQLEDIAIRASAVPSVDLMASIRSIIEIINEGTNVHVSVKHAFLPQIVDVDEHIVLRVFDNLFSNAMRYAKDIIEVTIKADSDRLSIIVVDDGKGFSPQDLKEAKQAFYREEGGDASHLGMGLYICHSLCVKHGGELKLDNRMEGGAQAAAEFAFGVDRK